MGVNPVEVQILFPAFYIRNPLLVRPATGFLLRYSWFSKDIAVPITSGKMEELLFFFGMISQAIGMQA